MALVQVFCRSFRNRYIAYGRWTSCSDVMLKNFCCSNFGFDCEDVHWHAPKPTAETFGDTGCNHTGNKGGSWLAVPVLRYSPYDIDWHDTNHSPRQSIFWLILWIESDLIVYRKTQCYCIRSRYWNVQKSVCEPPDACAVQGNLYRPASSFRFSIASLSLTRYYNMVAGDIALAKLTFFVTGIVGSLLVYGVLQVRCSTRQQLRCRDPQRSRYSP